MSVGYLFGEQDDIKFNFFIFFSSDLFVFLSFVEYSSLKKNVMKIWMENKENEIIILLSMDCDDEGCY